MLHPDTEICIAARDLAREHSEPFLYNHLMRTYAFGKAAGALRGAQYDEEVFFLGAVLHDLGLVERFVGEDRYEVDGADAAADWLSRQGVSDRKISIIWDAIALHTTPTVPQRKQPEIALVQLGAGIDVGAVPRSLITPETVDIILEEHPRLGFKEAMIAAMAEVVRRKPMTGEINLMGDVAREHGHAVRGFCDIVRHAQFAE